MLGAPLLHVLGTNKKASVDELGRLGSNLIWQHAGRLALLRLLCGFGLFILSCPLGLFAFAFPSPISTHVPSSLRTDH